MLASDPLAAPVLNAEFAGQSYRGYSLKGLRDAGLDEPSILASVQAALKVRIDESAEALRLRLLTPGVGQAMEYQQAYDEALAALQNPSAATAELYPMLAATVGIDIDPDTKAPATDILGVARSVKAAFTAWRKIGAEIRGVRLAGKDAIDAATSVEAAVRAASSVAWPAL